jgi:CRP/FNR family cyclic AMP-dependent transcriptional regulator
MQTGGNTRGEGDARPQAVPAASGADRDPRSQGLRALLAVPWLRDCEPATLAILLRRARLRSLAPGAAVTRRGAPATHLAVIVSGRVEVTRSSAAGRRFVVSYLGAGQVTGIGPAIDGRGAIHDGIACDAVRVLTVHRDDLREAIDTDRGLRWRVLGLLARRSRQLHEMLSDASVLPLPVRLARALLAMPSSADADGASLRVSQEGLAGMLGVPRQRVNAALQAFERDRVLRLAYRRIVVLDAPTLRARAQEPAD